MNDQEKDKLIVLYTQWCQKYGIDYKVYDIDAEIDMTLNYSENEAHIFEQLNNLISIADIQEVKKPQILKAKTQSINRLLNLTNNKPLAILGKCNSGKTNLMFYFAELISQMEREKKLPIRKKYLVGYPERLEGYTSLSSINDLGLISNAIVLIDEMDVYIPIYDKKQNYALQRLLKFSEHNNIKLIFTTQLSQFINKSMEAMISQWAIKDIDVLGMKNGSKPKRILQSVKDDRYIQVDGLIGFTKMGIDKFVWWNDDGIAGENGVHSFPDMFIGKCWNHNSDKNTAKKSE